MKPVDGDRSQTACPSGAWYVTTLASIADALNARGIRSARGGSRRISSVQNLIARSSGASL